MRQMGGSNLGKGSSAKSAYTHMGVGTSFSNSGNKMFIYRETEVLSFACSFILLKLCLINDLSFSLR